MCQAYDSEFRFLVSVELEFGSFKAFLDGQEPLPDYCREHKNYWCGCLPTQNDPDVRSLRSDRQGISL